MFFKSSYYSKILYLDHASATPLSPRVKSIFQKNLEIYANPSALHRLGILASQKISEARARIGQAFGVRAQDIYFFEGATEANNHALLMVIRSFQKKYPNATPHVITSALEHSSVLELLLEKSEKKEIDLTIVPSDSYGYIDIEVFKKSFTPNTIIVSICYANGEIGTIQDLKLLSKIVRFHKKQTSHFESYPYFHTDAVQAVQYEELISPIKLGVDMLTCNAAKIYGPKKIAALYIADSVQKEALLFGGNQEKGLRPGTENLPAIVAFAEAIHESRILLDSEKRRLQELKNYTHALLQNLPYVIFNSQIDAGLPHIINISFPDISHEEILIRLDAVGIMASVKSACKSGEEGDSHVIIAIRGENKDKLPTGSLRFSLGRGTRKRDIDRLVRDLTKITQKLYETKKRFF